MNSPKLTPLREYLGLTEVDCWLWDLPPLVNLSESPLVLGWELKEDLVNGHLSPRYTIDIGWYGPIDPSGHLGIYLIKDQDWESPVFQAQCATWHGLGCLSRLVVSMHQRLRELDSLESPSPG